MKDTLEKRAAVIRRIRAFFDGRGFTEVETPVRIDAPAPEEHIDCPPVATGGYLRASPELQMKKLLAAGMDRIYQIGPCFRDGERGSRHNPEFTMMEWYRRGASYLDIAADLEELMAELAADSAAARRRGGGAVRLRVRDAYLRFAGWDPWEKFDRNRFDFDMAEKIEPGIARIGGWVFLMDYPVQAASLARIGSQENAAVRGARERYAERWEFYADGVELANCFSELCDKDEQMRRFAVAKEARKSLKEADYPVDYEFIECLPRIGSAAGVALGVDRLIMSLTGAEEISAVRANL